MNWFRLPKAQSLLVSPGSEITETFKAQAKKYKREKPHRWRLTIYSYSSILLYKGSILKHLFTTPFGVVLPKVDSLGGS
jgi:hypothetical protein